MININIMLFDPQETYVCFIRYICKGDACHKPAKKRQQHQQASIQYVCASRNLI